MRNHTPIGAFKIRGGITFVDWMRREKPDFRGIVTATRGNHGQSIARAATAAGLIAKILVPHGNSTEKNEAMRGHGAELTVYGEDFDEARIEAHRISSDENLCFVPPFHPELVKGVATYAFELFTANPDLDTVYVPIGCGSGICGLIETRDALGLRTRIVGVVSENASAAKLSYEAGKCIETNSAKTIADGMAVRVPVLEALEIYSRGAERIVAVSEDGGGRGGPHLFPGHPQCRRRSGCCTPCGTVEGIRPDGRQGGWIDPLRRQYRYRVVH